MKKQIASAVAALFLLGMASAAMANPNDNHGTQSSSTTVAGGIAGSGEITVGGGTDTASANSNTSGSAISGTLVNGNGASYQTTTSIGTGTASAGATFTPTGVTASTGQTSVTTVNSYGASSGNTPGNETVSNNGESSQIIVNGTSGVSQVTTSAASNATYGEEAIGATLAIGGVAGYGAVSSNSGY
jgi:hypothetical protein